MSYPGVIKAFHYHENQDDLWFFPSGNAQVVLYDLREDSATNGKYRCILYGEENQVMLLIPKGVAHGYRVLGENLRRSFTLLRNPMTEKILMKKEFVGTIL